MKKVILLSFILFSLCGCVAQMQQASAFEAKYDDINNGKFVQENYKATDALVLSLTRQLDPNVPLIVATLVSIDELTESSRLGRTISEQIGSRLTHSGFQVIELKLRNNIFVKQTEGELLLSREISEIMKNHKAQAVVVGTYSTANNLVYVNLKMVSNFDNVIVAAHDYILPIDRNVSSLLRATRK
jgi:TolB-like protein